MCRTCVSLVYQIKTKTIKMKTYTVTTDSKTPDFYKNEMQSFVIRANNIKDAEKIGRRLAKREGERFINVAVSR